MSSSSGGSSSGSSGSGSSGSAQNTSGQITATQLTGSIGSTSSILNSFNNVGTGSGSSAVSPTNPLSSYYYNPMAQGYITVNSSGTATASNTPFGNALYGNVSSGGSTSGGRGSSSAFGGSSNSGSLGSFGGSSAGRSSSSLTGGTASIRSGTSGTAILFTGAGSYGPSIGRRNAVISAALKNGPRPILAVARRPDLQAIIARSSSLSNPAGITVVAEGGQIVLMGTVASEDERVLAANMLRMSPGGTNLRNDLTVGPGGGTIPGPGPMAAPVGVTPGPAPSAPPIGGTPGPAPVAPSPGS
jgi:hypothetical protein